MFRHLAALIDEENCIGCGKCIRICPTDAIVGAKHRLHTILPQYCTSCERCVNACPTNCISLKTPIPIMSQEIENQLISKKQKRLSANRAVLPNTIHSNTINSKIIFNNTAPKAESSSPSRKQLVADAIARAKARRNGL